MSGPGLRLGGAWALVPVKPLAGAKSRLAPALSPDERRRLQRRMLAGTCAALGRAGRLSGVAVCTADRQAAEIALAAGAVVLPEPEPRGLDAAVAWGAGLLASLGAETVAVVPADMPLLDPAEIDRAVALALAAGGPVVAPDRHRQGTNALVFAAARPPVFAYGPGSFARHAATPGAVTLDLASLALDIDTPEDLSLLERLGPPREPKETPR